MYLLGFLRFVNFAIFNEKEGSKLHFVLDTPIGLLETGGFSNKQTETAGTTAACCFEGNPSSSLLVVGCHFLLT